MLSSDIFHESMLGSFGYLIHLPPLLHECLLDPRFQKPTFLVRFPVIKDPLYYSRTIRIRHTVHFEWKTAR